MGRRNKGLNFNRRRHHLEDESIADILKLSVLIVVAILLAWFFVYGWGRRTVVIGSGMEPSLVNSEIVYLSKFSYLVKRPKAGDVVAFLPNGNKNTHYYVKRVVGVPGETLEVIDGRLYIDDIEYQSDIDYDKIADPGLLANKLTLQTDEYFVIGDNINASEDSRSGNIGPVKKELIEGRVWFRLSKGDVRVGFM